MSRRDLVWLALMGGVFLGWHIPLMFRTPTGMDEEFYGVVGITILRDGVPRIPYVPSRELASPVYKVDVTAYTLPPLSFYLQALMHLALGDGLGQARMASALEGLAAAWLVYWLARRWLGDSRSALWSAMLFLFGRAGTFPATTARPDMAATLFGLLSVALLVRDAGARRARGVAAAGAAAGLSLLSHPMGIVPCCQVGLVLLLGGPTGTSVRRRLSSAAIFSLTAAGVLSLWGLLIVRHPDLFRIQFYNNVLGRSGSGLSRTLTLSGLVTPFAFQCREFLGQVLAVQVGLYLLGGVLIVARSLRPWPGRALGYHLAASFVLLMGFMGDHSLRAYFAYPAAFACIAAGALAGWATSNLERWTRHPVLCQVATTLLLIGSLVPGSGIRTLAACLKHWNNPSYNAHQFAARIMADLDPTPLGAVGRSYALDFYLAGRPVVDAHYLEYLHVPYDYLLVGPEGLRISKVPREDLELIRSYGNPSDEFAPFAELYRPRRDRPPRTSEAAQLAP